MTDVDGKPITVTRSETVFDSLPTFTQLRDAIRDLKYRFEKATGIEAEYATIGDDLNDVRGPSKRVLNIEFIHEPLVPPLTLILSAIQLPIHPESCDEENE